MIRVGVVGVGSMGRNHARVLAELPQAELIGVADSDHDRAKRVASEFSTRAFSSSSELIAQSPDAVILAVPTALHEEIALEIIEGGCHVLVEKPIAVTVESAKRIIASANQEKRVLMVGHIERFNPVVAVMKKKVRADNLLLLEFTRVGPFPPRIKDVGVLVDLAVHDIDLALYLTGSTVKSVHALASAASGPMEDSAVLLLSLDSGTIVRITTNWLTPFKIRKISCATTEGYVEADLLQRRVASYVQRDAGVYEVEEFAVPFQEPLKSEILEFLAAIEEGRSPAVTGADGLSALDIAIKAQRKREPS